MNEASEVQPSDLPASARLPERASAPPATRIGVAEGDNGPSADVRVRQESRADEKPAGCACGVAPRLVYALGQIGYDFSREARLDSFVHKLAAEAGMSTPQRSLAYEAPRILELFEKHPWDAAAIEWTLSVEGTTIYAIRPLGPFAGHAYQELRRFLKEKVEEGVERVSVPGVVSGKATLLNGQSVPVIVPELRGMYSWTTTALADAVAGTIAARASAEEKASHARKRDGVRNFLARVYHEVRNLGLTPQDRALNFVATNAFQVGEIYTAAMKEQMELDRILVVPSPVCRPGSDCWDVEVYFFYPERQVQTVRKVYRFTVDVSDHVPVIVGTMRSWFTR
jgi:cyanobactin maturation PatA/PatG family protease